MASEAPNRCTPVQPDQRPASGEEQERHAVMAQTCFLANAGVASAMLKTIEIRPKAGT